MIVRISLAAAALSLLAPSSVAQCVGGVCAVEASPILVTSERANLSPQFVTVPLRQVVAVTPQRILVPHVQMVPYELQSQAVARRVYRTPIRDFLFGRYRVINNYQRVE
jgi:hypothetical protein